MLNHKTLWAAVAVIFSIACNPEKKAAYDLLISDVNSIDYESGKILAGKDIGILGDRIAFIRNHDNSELTDSEKIIDANGKYAIPGLWDNHIHLRGGSELIKANKEFLSLFIANGITGIRDAGGDLSPEVISWKNNIEEGNLLGPVIFTSGPKLDGTGATWAGSIEISDTTQVKEALDSLQSLKVDFVKLYDSKISREVYLKVLKEARLRNLITSGHMPFTVLLEENIENGIGSIEHLYYILKGCSIEETEITDQIRNGEIGFWDSFKALLASYDTVTANTTFKRLRTHQTYVTPTLHIGNVLSNLKTEVHSTDLYLKYVDSLLVKTYKGRIERALQANNETYKMRLELQESFKRLTSELHKWEVPLLAGSDCGAYNSFIYPGISLHQELEALVNAGLTPLEALKTSTFNGSRFLKKDSLYGTIEINKMADILLLEQNPLTNIKHTQNIHSVIFKGKNYPKENLKLLKDSTKN